MNTVAYLPKFKLLDPKDRLYQIPNPLIGLTGGIATGKSSVAKIFREMGFKVIDADALVKSIYQNPKTIEFIESIAPDSITDKQIDFKKLREKFFSHSEIKSKIESFIYSELPNAFFAELSSIPDQEIIIYDVPLLFEKKLNIKSDLSIVVYAAKDIQIQRLMKRDNISKDLAEKILNAQMPIEEKKLLADYVISNEESLEALKVSVNQFVIEKLKSAG